VFGVRVEKSLYLDVQELGIDLEKNANDLFREALRNFLKKYKKKKRQT
jgi:metal-responsive CopG/Arc/MetJ family transcriptional regulator